MNEFPSALELLQFALDYRGYLFWPTKIALLIWAFSKGGAPEKVIAAVMTVTVISSQLYIQLTGDSVFALTGVDRLALFNDFFLAVGFVAVALHANRIYPLWIAGLQLICLLAHLARVVAPDTELLAYAILVTAPTYGQLLVFALGIRAHRRRVARYGNYPSWRSSSFLSQATVQTR